MTIPVGWAILMIPEHPYRGSEMNAAAWRSWGLYDCSRQINAFIAERGQIPSALDAKALLQETNPYAASYATRPIGPETFYYPSYTRFSTGEGFRIPLVFNRRIAGKTPEQIGKLSKREAIPYITRTSPSGDIGGLFYFPKNQTVSRRYYDKGDSEVDWSLR